WVRPRRHPRRPGLAGHLLGSTTGWAMLLCLAGVAGSLAPLFPWAEVGCVRVYGYNCWQGIAAGWTFLGLGLLLIALGFREPLPAWQPALLSLAGVSGLVLTALYLPTIPPPDRVHLGPSGVLGLALGLLFLSALQIRGLLARATSPVESLTTRRSPSGQGPSCVRSAGVSCRPTPCRGCAPTACCRAGSPPPRRLAIPQARRARAPPSAPQHRRSWRSCSRNWRSSSCWGVILRAPVR